MANPDNIPKILTEIISKNEDIRGKYAKKIRQLNRINTNWVETWINCCGYKTYGLMDDPFRDIFIDFKYFKTDKGIINSWKEYLGMDETQRNNYKQDPVYSKINNICEKKINQLNNKLFNKNKEKFEEFIRVIKNLFYSRKIDKKTYKLLENITEDELIKKVNKIPRNYYLKKYCLYPPIKEIYDKLK